METEDSNVCLDKEPDCVTKYSNNISYDSNTENVPSLQNIVESYEKVNGDPEVQSSEGSIDSKDYEVKECTNVSSIKKNELTDAAKEEENIASPKFESCLSEKVKLETKKSAGNNKSRVPVKHASKPADGCQRTKCTVPKPFSLATEKRASSGVRPVGPGSKVNSGCNKGPTKSNLLQVNSIKGNQILYLVSRKPLQPKNKHADDTNSVVSLTSGVTKTNKTKTIVPSAPVFRCTERAEKRKEFYSKLEEKQQALEAERMQIEARTKEEIEAAIKQLRKSLTFKANPMPSFYHEGPPPKLQLKKQPPTRAKSPKLGRQKRCSDTVSSSSREKNTEASAFPSSQESIEDGDSACKFRDDTIIKNESKQARRDIAVES